jgi:thioredoxin-dependent peroxiredoxin
VEGQGLRDRAPEFDQAGAEIVGVSFDSPDLNRQFRELQGFPFRLLSDVDRSAGQAYETKRAPEEPNPEWAKRRTYLIDPEGVIRKAYRVGDIPGHPNEVLKDLTELQAG